MGHVSDNAVAFVEKGSSVSGSESRCFHSNPKRQRGRRAFTPRLPRSRFGLLCTQKRKSLFFKAIVCYAHVTPNVCQNSPKLCPSVHTFRMSCSFRSIVREAQPSSSAISSF